jgi:signal transduction histidine kinase
VNQLAAAEATRWVAILAVDALLLGAAAWWMWRVLQSRVREAGRTAAEDARNAEIASMTRGLAHEIKNPLSTVALNAQLLREEILDSGIEDAAREGVSRRVDTLAREAARLKDILNDFLRYAGRMQLDRRPTDVAEAVAELVDFFLPQAEQAGVRLVDRMPAGPAIADVDPALLKQALLNLLLNGIQAMEALPPDRARTLAVSVIPELAESRGSKGSRLAIVVQDSGPGLSNEALAHAFEPYFTTKAGGNGLGLATARRIVEAHGGRIEVSNAPGGGARFRIELPATPIAAAQGISSTAR